MEIWPHAEVSTLEHVGHWVTEEAQDEVQQLVSDFLQRTDSNA